MLETTNGQISLQVTNLHVLDRAQAPPSLRESGYYEINSSTSSLGADYRAIWLQIFSTEQLLKAKSVTMLHSSLRAGNVGIVDSSFFSQGAS